MNNKKECNNCIWFDRCGCDSICEYYHPLNEEELAEEEYEEALEERVKEYNKFVREMNS